MSVAIRRATPDDAALLAEHRALVWFEGGDWAADVVASERVRWLGWMRDAVARGSYVGFVADGDVGVLGSACVLVHEAIPRPGSRTDRDGRVHSVYVAPAFRRRGIGRALMVALLAYARDAGLMRLKLHPTAMSRALYASVGFEPAEEMALSLTMSEPVEHRRSHAARIDGT